MRAKAKKKYDGMTNIPTGSVKNPHDMRLLHTVSHEV